ALSRPLVERDRRSFHVSSLGPTGASCVTVAPCSRPEKCEQAACEPWPCVLGLPGGSMLATLRAIVAHLRHQAKCCYESDPPAAAQASATDGTMGMLLHRLMQGSRRAGLAPLEMLFNKMNAVFSNCIIGRGAEFGRGFVLTHATGVVINGSVRGGSNVYIEHQV